jgi:hypothetical protein
MVTQPGSSAGVTGVGYIRLTGVHIDDVDDDALIVLQRLANDPLNRLSVICRDFINVSLDACHGFSLC